MNNTQQQRKNLALLIFAVLFFIYAEKVLLPYLNPEQKKPVAQEKVENAENKLTTQTTTLTNPPAAPQQTAQKTIQKELSSAAHDEKLFLENLITVETKLTETKISPYGGRIVSHKLKNYKAHSPNDEALYDMVVHRQGTNFPGGISILDAKGQITDSDIQTLYNAHIENNGLLVRLEGTLPNGEKIEKTFSFSNENYLFDVTASVNSLQKKTLSFEWLNEMPANEASLLDSYNVVGFVWLKGDVASREQIANMKAEKTIMDLSCVRWVGVGDKYFATALVSKEEVPLSTDSKNPCPQGTLPNAHVRNAGEVAHVQFTPLQNSPKSELSITVFSGPKSYKMLKEIGFELKRLVDLGTTGFISAPLLSFLHFFYGFVGNYGLAIVLLTICVKLCLYPLNTAQYRQMKALQALKPEMDRIRDTITDKQQQQLAMMELYKKKGVNPLGGCLPALIQMPIFIGLYSALMLAVELRHAPYGMWVYDLSAPDKLMVGGIGIPVLVVLFTVSIMVQQWITPSNMDETQKKAMMIMPVVMFFMFMNFPAGLALYWLTNNLISIGQQEAIKFGDKSGKSGLSITLGVAVIVFIIAYVCTKL